MLQEPLFLDDFNPFSYYQSKLFAFLDSIVSQGPKAALRRGQGQWLMFYYQSRLGNKILKENDIEESDLKFMEFIQQKTPYLKKWRRSVKFLYFFIKFFYYPRAISKKIRAMVKNK